MKLARAALLASIAFGPSCARTLPPRGQIVLYIDTDAIVRSAVADPLALSPQVDRVRFDLLRGTTAVQNGARVFEIDQDALRAQTVSFGVVPDPGTEPLVRVRLYRADRATGDDPPRGVVIDQTVSLPPVPDEGIVEAFAFLSADRFGTPDGPLPAALGRPGPSRVGTWRGGRRVGCAAPPNADEACVPGSTFFFGDPQFRGRTVANDIIDERVVSISPFYLDVHEVTVADLRAKLSPGVPAPAVHVENQTDTDAGFCTFTTIPGTFEGLPVTCISWNMARAYCQSSGKDLPTEAQFELVASGLGDELAYPWGDDEADCAGAVWGRGGTGLFLQGSTFCRNGEPSLPALPGANTRDKVDTSLRGGAGASIVDLGGNVSEWMVDAWSEPGGFWADLSPKVDPIVTQAFPAATDMPKAVRGGAFPFTVLTTRAAFRVRKGAEEAHAEIGFRCARHADPASAP